MPRSAALLAGAIWLMAAPLAAQVGLGSAPRSVTLMATRLSSVSVGLPTGTLTALTGSLTSADAARAPIPVTTSWNVDPAQPVAVTLVVLVDGSRREAPLPLFTQPISGVNARSGRTDDVQVGFDPGTLTLVAITQ